MKGSIYLVSILVLMLMSPSAISSAEAQASTKTAEPSADLADQRGPDASKFSQSASRQKQLESILGRDVRTTQDDMGRIIDLLADRDGQVQAAAVELGGFLGIGTRKIVVPWSAFRFEDTGNRSIVILNMTRDQLRLAPEYKPTEPVMVRGAGE